MIRTAAVALAAGPASAMTATETEDAGRRHESAGAVAAGGKSDGVHACDARC